MPHLVMKHWDPMLGVDFHMVNLPPAPPAGPAPYATFDFLSGLYIFFKPIWKHPSLYGATVAKGTDIGSGIPHIGPPSVTLPLEIAFSSSKSHFASVKYKADVGPPALAVALFLNINLNCGTPMPTPTGIVICFNTHGAGMSLGDILAGFFSMAADWAIQTLLQALGDKFGKIFEEGLGKIISPLTASSPAIQKFLASYGGTILGFLLGGPMGADIGTFGGYATDKDGNSITPGGWLASFEESTAENLGQALGDYIENGSGEVQPPTYQKPVSGPTPQIPNVTNNPPPL